MSVTLSDENPDKTLAKPVPEEEENEYLDSDPDFGATEDTEEPSTDEVSTTETKVDEDAAETQLRRLRNIIQQHLDKRCSHIHDTSGLVDVRFDNGSMTVEMVATARCAMYVETRIQNRIQSFRHEAWAT
ncbi:MAG: hypothetical protein JNM43_28965 [Planctomycetaceae bacterium]|nr:hypothetical protein [Planctomycetaceae bacterium]